jgi:L-ascorbate metabolism protein UlaG (beta-lactamase superfamily)
MGSGRLVFVRDDARAEPLVNGFRAWPHLLSPHTYACNLLSKHLPTLRAMIAEARDEHVAEQLRALLAAIEVDRPALVEFGEAIRALDDLLLNEAKGFALEDRYERVPGPLRGFVELVYDRYNQPGARFLEGMLFRGPHYDPSLQALRLSRMNPDEPGAGLGVPRLAGPGDVAVTARFDSTLWDVLGAARRTPVAVEQLAAALGTEPDALADLVTTEQPGVVPAGSAAGPRVRFVGHACVLLQTDRTAVLVDPLIPYRGHGATDRFSFADLPDRIDCLAITHAHLDHLDIETLLQIRHLVDHVVVPRVGAGDLLDPSLKLVLEAIGFDRVHELDDFESLAVTDGQVVSVPFQGEHADLTIRGKCGYAVSLGGGTFWFLADSQCLEPRVYELAREHLGPVAALFLGMECEGSAMTVANRPYLPERVYTTAMAESRRTKASDAANALALVDALRPGRAYVYAMGLEPWLAYMFGVPDPTKSYSLSQVEVFERACAERGVPARLLNGHEVLDLAMETA